ncbi:invasin, partial [Kosakonia cowanii]
GVYTVTVTAGTDNETVTLTPAVSGVTLSPAVVTITATTPDQAKSAIKTDKATYVSGADMAVTVTLKDAQDNAVTGAASSLTTDTVTVQNATLKSGSSWKETGEGTGIYTATYTATTAGTGLKATVKLGGWGNPASSEAYAITATTPDQAKSGIKTDKATYVSGADMAVTVTLKDAQGNAVTGAASLLTTDTVTVQNATLKSGRSWKETGEGTGIYTATYTATTAGTGLKATVKLGGWGNPASSEAYAITATTPDQAKSGIKTDKATYVSGADMAVTVTLKDAQGNAVTGAASLLTAETVTVQHATLKGGSGWKDNGDGTYTAAYRAATAGTGLKAAVKLGGWGTAAESGAYIIYGTATLKDISVNGYTFRPDEGFPTTGFKGAEFTLNLKSDNGGSTSDYIWTADAPWVSVTDGVVRFTGKGTGNRVTVTGMPKSGTGRTITHSFALKSWFINSSSWMVWSDADAYCSSQVGYRLPTIAQMTLHSGYKATEARGPGALWNEWGHLGHYSGAGFSDYVNVSSSESKSFGIHHGVNLYFGYITNGGIDGLPHPVVCRQGF